MNYVNCFSAAVLAGGLSTRMGQDKASLPFGGETLLSHQMQKLRALRIDDLMISGWRELLPNTRLIPDEVPRCGPLGGIHACLKAAKHDAVLFLSVDVPLVPPEALEALLQAHTGGATVLTVGDKREPLIAVYDRAVLPDVEALLQSNRRAVRFLLDRIPVHEVSFTGDPSLLQNCNTPAEYAEALKKGLL